MKQYLSLFLLLLSGFGLVTKNVGQDFSKVIKPQVFGEEIFAGIEIFRGSFAPDGRTFYFFKKVTKGEEDYRIFVSKLVNGKWSEPIQLNLGGDFSDLYPSISKDGKRMVFSSYRPAPGDNSAKPNAHLWYVDKKGNDWGTPVFIKAVNKLGYYHSGVEQTIDSKICFTRITPDWKTKETVISRWNGKDYEIPVLFDEVEQIKKQNPDIKIGGGSIIPSGKLMFLDVATKNPQNGKNASDIWISLKENNQWSKPKPLGAEINSDGYDVFPFLSPDGKELYFVRDFKTFYKIDLKTAIDSIETASSQSSVEAELMQLERDIGQANINRDKTFFERIEADEFIYTDSGGGITTKAQDVASLDKPIGEFKLVSYEVDEMKVKVYGDTAVVWGRVTTTLKGKDREVVNKSRFTDTFVKREGRWQLVAGHSSRIREPQK